MDLREVKTGSIVLQRGGGFVEDSQGLRGRLVFRKGFGDNVAMSKDYIDWMCFKTELERKLKGPVFSEREICWCSVGLNVGKETDGKNEFFNRPVLVLRKFNKWTFYGVPLSSQLKDNRYYLPIHF